MNKIRPYLFWIICGAVVLVELVLLLFIAPSDGDKTPESAKQEIDDKKRKLDDMHDKAAHAPPVDHRYDPLNKKDIEDLTKKYLATEYWKPPLVDELQRYGEQLAKIKDHLLERSKSLHVKISPEQNTQWYQAYELATGNLLQKLYDAGCLKLPKAAGPGGGPGGPPAGLPGPGATTAAGSAGSATGGEAADPKPDFKEGSSLRNVAGFVTKQHFDDLDYDDLTLKYNMMGMIAAALVATEASNIASPAAPNKVPTSSHVKLFKTVFAESSGGNAEDTVHLVTIDLEGPLSALLAAEAALEENKGSGDALRAVIGATLSRPVYAGDEALHVSSEPLDLELKVAFLDFPDLINFDTNCMPKQQAAAPAAPPPARPASATARSADEN